jgi:phosphopantetheinyl transferase
VIYGASGADGKAVAPALLAEAVRLTWGWEDLPDVARSPRGKPYFPAHPHCWFSISHSGGLALCALSDEGAVGVDIEVIRPRSAGLPDYAMSPTERAAWDGTWADFYRVWTFKESWCKREDIPIYPPRNLVTPPPCPHQSYAGETWRAAVCCTGAPPEDIIWLRNLKTT